MTDSDLKTIIGAEATPSLQQAEMAVDFRLGFARAASDMRNTFAAPSRSAPCPRV